MTSRFRCLSALVALSVAMTSAAAHERASPPPSAAPTPNPSVQQPTAPPPPVKPAAHLFIPQWKTGLTWTIECDFPDGLTAGTPPWVTGQKRNSVQHPRFQFTVDKQADYGKLRLFMVKVTPVGSNRATSADLVFAGEKKDDGSVVSLFLMKGLYRLATGSNVASTRRDYNAESKGPFPVINEENGIPTDFPFLSYAEVAGHDGKGDGFWKEYQAAQAIEGDRRSRAVRQTILFASDKMQFGEKYKVSVRRAECFDVFMKMLNSPGNETVRLVFNPAYPWPVYGEGSKGRFWLIP